MILVQSISHDYSTHMVIDWLSHQKKQYKRLNDNCVIDNFNLSESGLSVSFVENGNINCNDISSYWYRRGSFQTNITQLTQATNKNLKDTYESYQKEENNAVEEIFIAVLNSKKKIGNLITCNNVNKILILNLATQNGIKIPEYIITNNKKDIVHFKKKVKKIITKSIAGNFLYKTDKYWYPNYTTELSSNLLKKIPTQFSFSLIQKLIDKKFEIRAFYLMGKFYSMAIFSQNDRQTKIDFRQYNYDKPNRTVPFKLPKNIEKKLDALMKSLSYESGSIDLLYSTENEYIFLEINPVGQFGMVSQPCNYYLEKKIADYLT